MDLGREKAPKKSEERTHKWRRQTGACRWSTKRPEVDRWKCVAKAKAKKKRKKGKEVKEKEIGRIIRKSNRGL
jgi:hypothetical protein